MRMKRRVLAMILVLAIASAVSGCRNPNRPSPESPVTLNMWHNYGGEMPKTMDELIDEFNSTVGAEQGINVNVSVISSSAELNTSLGMIVNDDPGAPEMPDICTAYPKVAIKFQQNGKLADFNDYFTQAELDRYIPAFIEEGRIEDGLYVFPLAKSTEILYLNQTLFDRFAKATGASAELQNCPACTTNGQTARRRISHTTARRFSRQIRGLISHRLDWHKWERMFLMRTNVS